MKNIITLSTPENINEFVYNLWRTDNFRNSHNEKNGYINKIISKFSEVPRFFYTMTSEIEHSHFTTWFNVIALRPNYENNAISDLYYLHEIFHAATMYFNSDLSWNDWFNKTALNEMEASLESEAFAYFELNGLREQSFSHRIWVDKFLKDLNIKKNYRAILTEERKIAMRSIDAEDFIDAQIANYTAQNLQWAKVWTDRWTVIEKHMSQFLELSKSDVKAAINLHHTFLAEYTDKSIPFYKEAVEFYNIYKKNNAKYGNALIKK